jgi:AcrR family transcriptional regulator
MRRVGQALGVEAMSLYKHVANKEEILDGLLELVVADVDLPAPGEPWRPAQRRRAISAREVFGRHPWSTTLLQSRRNPGPATLGYYDAILGSLRGGGFPVALAAQAFALLDSYVYGFVVQERSLPLEAPGGLQEVTSDIMAGFDAGAYPHLVEMAVEHVLTPGYSWGDQFAFGLDLILDGLERAVEAST